MKTYLQDSNNSISENQIQEILPGSPTATKRGTKELSGLRYRRPKTRALKINLWESWELSWLPFTCN